MAARNILRKVRQGDDPDVEAEVEAVLAEMGINADGSVRQSQNGRAEPARRVRVPDPEEEFDQPPGSTVIE